MPNEKEKPKPKSMPPQSAKSHEDEQLPPARAAAQLQREAALWRMVSGPLIDKMKAKKKPAP